MNWVPRFVNWIPRYVDRVYNFECVNWVDKCYLVFGGGDVLVNDRACMYPLYPLCFGSGNLHAL